VENNGSKVNSQGPTGYIRKVNRVQHQSAILVVTFDIGYCEKQTSLFFFRTFVF